jgi:predicted O-methyltransferase YrrM
MDVEARTTIVQDTQAAGRRLVIDGFRLTAADRVAALVARVRYPPSRFEHHYPRWNGITGWLSARQGARLFDLARCTDARGDIVEIGSAFGRSTVALALGTRARGGGKVYGIDPHTGGTGLVERYGPLARTFSSLGPFLQNIVRFGLQDIIVPITLRSDEAAAVWPGGPIRLLFVDGWHDYDACRRDILSWARWVAPGGILVIHDYDWPDVRRAVDDCLPQLNGFGGLDTEDPNMAITRRDGP